MSQHHAGRVGYHEGEVGFERVLARGGGGGGGMGAPYNAFIELNDKGEVWIHYAQPDSGTNHGTAMATQVAEILGRPEVALIRPFAHLVGLVPPEALRPDRDLLEARPLVRTRRTDDDVHVASRRFSH